MALTTEEKRLIDNATPGLARVKLSEKIEDLQDAIENQTFSGSASSEADGLMSKEDFDKLAGIDPEANKYVLPAATDSAIGGVKMAVNVPEAADAAPTAAEFKALLDALIAAGVMAAPSAP